MADRAGCVRSHTFLALDLLRGVAAFAVLLWHVQPLDGPRWWAAYLSVDLFFVLSGFVIAHAYGAKLGAGLRPARFVAMRIVRLWPMYLLGSTIGGGVVLVDLLASGDGALWRLRQFAEQGALALVMAPRLSPIAGNAYPFNPNAWSLFAEMIVNIAFCLGGFRLRSRTLLAIAAGSGAMLGWFAFYFAGWNAGLNLGGLALHLGVGCVRAAYGFTVGVLLHRLWMARPALLPSIPPSVAASAFVLVLLLVPGTGPAAPIAGCVAIWVAMPAIVAIAIRAEPTGWMRWMAVQGGRLSYPLYAVQGGCYLAAAALAAHGVLRPTVAYVIAFAVSVTAAPFAERLDSWTRQRIKVR